MHFLAQLFPLTIKKKLQGKVFKNKEDIAFLPKVDRAGCLRVNHDVAGINPVVSVGTPGRVFGLRHFGMVPVCVIGVDCRCVVFDGDLTEPNVEAPPLQRQPLLEQSGN